MVGCTGPKVTDEIVSLVMSWIDNNNKGFLMYNQYAMNQARALEAQVD